MPHRVLRALASLTVMIAMTLGMMPFSGGHWLFHGQSGVAAIQVTAPFDEHGHSHDDDDVNEQSAAHPHGHNPADHTHETPSLPVAISVVAPVGGQGWQKVSSRRTVLETAFRLERPPRPILKA